MNQYYSKVFPYVFVLLFSTFVFSQVSDFKVHSVSKGETLYGISKAYNLTVQNILDANPQYQNEILQEGDQIRIPIGNLNNSNSSVSNASNTNSDGQIIHVVQSGETKFGLSKRYNVSIAQLERDNPHIISMLQVGHKVVIQASVTSISNESNQEFYVVKPGETLWGLAKRYNITVDQLRESNRDLLQGVLRSGQNLRIPSGQAVREEESGFYVVQKGDTKFGLSRKNGLTIQEFERLNPHTVSMLQIGHRVTFGNATPTNNYTENRTETQQTVQSIPQSSANQTSQSNEIETKSGYYKYEIQSKETLFSLSKKAGISQESLLELNPDLRTQGVKTGMLIWMPDEKSVVQTTVTMPQSQNTPTQVKPEDSILQGTNETSTATYSSFSSDPNAVENLVNRINTQKTIKVTFVFSQETESRNALQVNNEIPYYQGVMWALDSLKKLNVKVEPTFLSTDAKNYKNNGWKRSFKNADLVIGPFSESALNDLASFSQAQSQTLHVPIASNQILKGQLVYSYPTDFHQIHALIEFLNTKKGNIVVVNDGLDDPSTPFIREHFPNAKFAPMDSRGNINFDRLNVAFSKTQPNFVVLTTQKTGVIIATTNFLLNQMGNYSIQLAVANEKLIPSNQDVSEMRLKILKLIVPKVVVKDVKNQAKRATEFQKKYGTPLNANVYQAFDQTFDLILRQNVFDSFESSSSTTTSQQTMNFQYTKSFGGFWNKAIQIVQMDTN
jgi:LysM repeat protein